MQISSRWSQQVSDEGDVLYVFPKDYRAKLATKSLRIKLEPFFEKAKVFYQFILFNGLPMLCYFMLVPKMLGVPFDRLLPSI